MQKVTKSTKSKSSKMTKMEKWKSEKTSKMSKTPKWPKCQINGTFWHFAKSEPPGWALFRFQGVPRDPILRPKSTCRILNGKKVISIISHFTILVILMFLHLWYFGVFCVLLKVTFLWWWCFMTAIVIRPYCNVGVLFFTQGGVWWCVVVSPLG